MIEKVTAGAIICFNPRSNMSFARNLKEKVPVTNVRLFEYRDKMFGVYRQAPKADSTYYTYTLYELTSKKIVMRKENDHDETASKELMVGYCMQEESKNIKDY